MKTQQKTGGEGKDERTERMNRTVCLGVCVVVVVCKIEGRVCS